MKIAVSSQDKAHITGHLGHCRKFWIYNLEADQVQGKDLFELTKDQIFHESSPQQTHPLDGVEVLISGGMGRGLARRLETMGIVPIITPETDPDAAISAYRAGTLAVTTLEDHAQHHDHDHGHDQGHGHGHDHQHQHQHQHRHGGDCGCHSA